MSSIGFTPNDPAALAALRRRLDRPLVLVGLMGVGKTTVGMRLARALTLPFVDADREIERAAQMKVTEIFERFGEAHFRDGERRVIARLLESRSGVLATGGGAFCDAETRALILSRGLAIWLDSDIETLVERTGRRSTRPLLQGGNPRETLERLQQERKSAYSEAPIRIISDSGPHASTVARILEAVDQWL